MRLSRSDFRDFNQAAPHQLTPSSAQEHAENEGTKKASTSLIIELPPLTH